MKHTSFIKRNLLLALGAIAMLTTSCIKEDLDACKNYKLTLKVVNPDENDITPLGVCSEASLYIFDENGKLLETRQLDKDFITSRQEIELKNYKSGQKLQMIAWGNLRGQKNQTVADAKTIEELQLSLKSNNGVAPSPDTLYFGQKTVMAMDGGVSTATDTVVVRLKTSTMTIITQGYAAYAQKFLKSSDEISFGLEKTLDSYNASGIQTGDSVSYDPESKMNEGRTEWLSTGIRDADSPYGGVQNIFAGENMGCSVYKNGQLLKTVYTCQDTKTGEDRVLSVKETERANILIIFGEDGNISAKLSITPWGIVDDKIDF